MQGTTVKKVCDLICT